MAESDPEKEAAALARKKEQAGHLGAVPAFFVDTWHIWTWEGHARITFGEEMGEADDVYRSAVVMDTDNALAFAKHLLRLVERRKKRDLEIRKEAEETPGGES